MILVCRVYIFITVLLVLIDCTSCYAEPASSLCKKSPSFLKAVHYFSSANPLNFWEFFEEKDFFHDFSHIVEDGFNAIIIVIPWTGIQTKTNPIVFDQWLLQRVKKVVLAASEAGLYILGRIGYSHNFNVENDMNGQERCVKLLIKNDLGMRHAWKAYISALKAVTFDVSERYLQHFTTWEDFFCLMSLPAAPTRKENINLAKEIGLTEYIVERNPHYRKSKMSIPFPKNGWDSPEIYKLWINYMNQLWWNVVEWSREVSPLTSMEIRTDMVGIRIGATKEVKYLSLHDQHTSDNGSCTLRGAYWASYMGNTGMISADEAMRSFELLSNQMSNSGQKTNFVIEQFNFRDNTPEFRGLHAWIDLSDVPIFLLSSTRSILSSSAGYGLWAYRNYRQSALYNGSFEKGLAGWNVRGMVNISHQLGENILVVHALGDSPAVLESAPFAQECPISAMRVCFQFQSLTSSPESSLKISVGEITVMAMKLLNSTWTEHCSFLSPTSPLPNGPISLRIAVTHGHILLDEFECFCHILDLGVYDKWSNPLPYHEAIMQLNNYIDYGSPESCAQKIKRELGAISSHMRHFSATVRRYRRAAKFWFYSWLPGTEVFANTLFYDKSEDELAPGAIRRDSLSNHCEELLETCLSMSQAETPSYLRHIDARWPLHTVFNEKSEDVITCLSIKIPWTGSFLTTWSKILIRIPD